MGHFSSFGLSLPPWFQYSGCKLVTMGGRPYCLPGSWVPSVCLMHFMSGGKQVICKVQSLLLALSQPSVVRHQYCYLWHSDKEVGPGEWNGLLGSPSKSQTEQELESSVCPVVCSTSLPSGRSLKLICSCQNVTSHREDTLWPNLHTHCFMRPNFEYSLAFV